ncbi:MAG TPA: trypsin-like serine protease [Solirubrobacteraceae bacterium]|nr:trypsin-like serine protease [Solirubrobacteraceae bacterium]
MSRTRASWIGVLAAAATVMAPSAAQARLTPGIVGGHPAAGALAASLALVVSEGSGGETEECSGTVVAPRLVLTAAHCLARPSGSGWLAASTFRVVTRARSTRGATVQRSRLVRAFPDPRYSNARFADDAALLVLARPTAAAPVELESAAASPDLSLAGGHRFLAGWGDSRAGQLLPQHVALEAEVVIQPAEVCARDAWQSLALPFVAGDEICTLGPQGAARGACHGDSGGPLLARSDRRVIEVGVVSHGEGDCSTAVPTYLTRSAAISRWVGWWIARLGLREG